MKALRIFALLLVMGVSQAGATGFVYNMNQAQKMLRAGKEVVPAKKAPKQEVRFKEELKKARERERVSDTGPAVESDELVPERVVDTLAQWVSQLLMKILMAGTGIGR